MKALSKKYVMCGAALGLECKTSEELSLVFSGGLYISWMYGEILLPFLFFFALWTITITEEKSWDTAASEIRVDISPLVETAGVYFWFGQVSHLDAP